MPIHRILTSLPDMPEPRASFCHGLDVEGRFLYVSGQGPYDPSSGGFVCHSIAEQTTLTLACIDRILLAAGTSRDRVVSCRIYLNDLTQASYAEMNAVYREFFGEHKPARTTIGARLLDIDVEIECVALIEK